MRFLIEISQIQFQARFNVKKLKVMTIVGTRPEIIRLSRVIFSLDEYCDHILVHTGQNYDYELNEIFFKDLGIRKPNYFLESAKGNAAQTIGNTKTIAEIAYFLAINNDLFLNGSIVDIDGGISYKLHDPD